MSVVVLRWLFAAMASTALVMASPCSQAGCDPQRTYRSQNTVPLDANAARTVWQNVSHFLKLLFVYVL